jgi:hypothetical protein
MSQPATEQNETRNMKKVPNAHMDESIKTRLPRSNGPASREPVPPVSAPTVPAPEPRRRPYQFLPAFWTIASVISLTVNVILLIVLLMMVQMRSALQQTATEQASGLLGGLYTNFVKMDQATIATNIPVDANIPLDIVVPVQATTQIRLAEAAVIENAHVQINTPSLTLNARAVVTLPAETPLTVRLDFPLPVQDTIPVHLDVPVKIPLNETELHEPFVGLQEVVEPWYCLIEPEATVNGLRVCSPATNPASLSVLLP